MKRVRFIVIVLVLLVFRALTRGWSTVSIGINRFLDWVAPVQTDIAVLGAAISGDFVDITVLLVEPIGTGVLYLAVFFVLIRALYPESLWEALERSNATRKFIFVISLHVVAVYIFAAVVLPAFLGLGIEIFRREFFGYPPVLWFWVCVLFYFLVFMLVSIAYVLSIPDDGLRSRPRPDSAALDFMRGFAAEDRTSDDIDSAPVFWINQAAMHAIPPVALGLLFVFFDIIFPTVEILLAIGVVLVLSPWQAVQPGDLDHYDIEHRLANSLRFATVNVKGLIAAMAVVAGVIIGGLAMVSLAPIGLTESSHGHRALDIWNRIGFLLGISAFAVVSTLYWLSIADRLPWFISAWSERNDTFEGYPVSLDGDPQRRSPLSLELPTFWVILALALGYSTHPVGPILFAVFWPACLLGLGRQSVGNHRDYPPLSDNVAIARGLPLAFLVIVLSVTASGVEPSTFGLISLSISTISGTFAVVIIVLFVHTLPDVFHRINEYHSSRTADVDPETGAQSRQRKARLLLTIGSTVVITIFASVFMMVNFEGGIPSSIVFLLLLSIVFFVVIYWMDSDVFEKGDEVDDQTVALVYIGISVMFFCIGYIANFYDSSPPYATPFMIGGVIGIICFSALLGYYQFKQRFVNDDTILDDR